MVSHLFWQCIFLNFHYLPLIRQNQLCLWTKPHCTGARGRGTPHNKYRSEQNQHYCSALQDNAVGSVFLFSLNAKGNTCSHDISPSIIPLFLAQQEILNQLSSNSKTLTPHNFCENKQADYGDTRGTLPRTKGCCASAVVIFCSGW